MSCECPQHFYIDNRLVSGFGQNYKSLPMLCSSTSGQIFLCNYLERKFAIYCNNLMYHKFCEMQKGNIVCCYLSLTCRCRRQYTNTCIYLELIVLYISPVPFDTQREGRIKRFWKGECLSHTLLCWVIKQLFSTSTIQINTLINMIFIKCKNSRRISTID